MKALFNYFDSRRVRGRRIIVPIVLLLSAGQEAYCQDNPKLHHNKLISISGKDLTPYDIQTQIKDQTGIDVGFVDTVAIQLKTWNSNISKVTIDAFLKIYIAGKGLEFKRSGDTTYLIRFPTPGQPVLYTLSAKVKNRKGEPMEGATVLVERTNHMLFAGPEGEFVLTDTARSLAVEISFTGYFTSRTLVSSHTPDIVLELNDNSLDEVMIEAYGTAPYRLETGDIGKLNGSEIRKQPVGNPLEALEGRIPGLAITETSGVPGSSLNVQIRGQNSLFNGNTPYILVDHVPVPPNNSSLSFIPSGSANGLPGMSPMVHLNPADIESIEALKDADATAIYGSRAANGVLLITTNKSKAGPLRISAGFSIGASRAINTPHLLNTPQYIAMREEAIRNDDTTPNVGNAPDLVSLDTNRYTDWKKGAIGNTASFQDNHLSVAGGNELFNYLFSGSSHRQSTVFQNSPGEQTYSGQIALGLNSKDKRLSLQTSNFYSTVDNHLPVFDPTQFIYLAPNAPSSYDPIGKYSWRTNDVSSFNIPAQRLNTYHALTKDLFTHWDIGYKLLKGLEARASIGYNSITTSEVSIEPIASQDPNFPATGSYFTGSTRFAGLIGEPQLEYSRKWGSSNLDLLSGATWYSEHSRHTGVTVGDYTNDSSLGEPGQGQILHNQDSNVLYLYEAMFLRAKLELADKYIFSVSARRDGSSRFGPGHQFGNFGSVAAAWLFQKEKFFPDWPVLSYGKLRGSYGVTGNDQIGDYQYAQSWRPIGTMPYGGLTGIYPATTDNPKLAWELVHKLEGALELGAWHDRLFFSAAWYRDWSGNQLIYSQLPRQTGYQGVTANLPVVVENTGWEFVLRKQEKASDHLTWNSSFSLTIPRNRLKSFPDIVNSGYAGKLTVGQSVNTIRAFQSLGVDPATGYYHFRDLNGDGRIDTSDLVSAGSTDLRAYAGWSNEFNYKGWQLSVFFDGRQQKGYDPLVQLYRGAFGGAANSPGRYFQYLEENEPVDVLHRWQKPGDQQPVQRFTENPSSAASDTLTYYVQSTAELRDAGFIRLRNVTLAYTLQKKALNKLHLQSGRIYLQVQNPLTFTKYPVTDPETQNPKALPPLRTMGVGIQFSF